MVGSIYGFILAFASLTHAITTQTLQPVSCNIDVLFIVDNCNSFSEFVEQRNFISGLSQQFDVGPQNVQIGAVTYCDSASNFFGFNAYQSRSQVQSAFSSLSTVYGSRNVGNALRFARTNSLVFANGARPAVAQFAIVFLNGEDANPLHTASQAQQLKMAGVTVVAIGLGVSIGTLQKIASSNDLAYTVSSYEQQLALQRTLATKICDASVALQQCLGDADILFILDSSGSIGSEDFAKQLNFVSSVTSHFPIGPNDVQFAALVFSTPISNDIAFNDHSNLASLQTAIQALPFYGRLTYTGRALRSARIFSFTPANGARPNTGKIAIVITDGESSDESNTILEAFLLKKSGVSVIVIGVGPDVLQGELEAIASSPSVVFRVDNYDVLDALRSQLVDVTCFIKQQQQTNTDCIVDSCIGREDGDYPACEPECKEGYYYSCVNQFLYRMPCGLGWYEDDHKNRFLARLVYNPETNSCERESDSCPRDPQNYVVTTTTTNNDTQTNTNDGECIGPYDSCKGRADGNYALCAPECQEGFFITCSNEDVYEMPCGLGWYLDSYNQRFTARMVYNPSTDSCELTADYCPRDVTQTNTQTQTTETTTDPDPDPQPINCTGKADILFLVDSSDGIPPVKYEFQLQFMRYITGEYTIGPNDFQFSTLIYGGDDTQALFRFNTYQNNADIFDALTNIPYIGGRNLMARALDTVTYQGFARFTGARDDAAKIAIVVSDGNSVDTNETIEAAQRLKDKGVYVMVIRTGYRPRDVELRAIASDPYHVFTINNIYLLMVLEKQVAAAICYESRVCNARADIIFLFDGSRRIGGSDFSRGLQFASDLSNYFTVGEDRVHFAAIVFSDYASLEFPLDSHLNNNAVSQALLNSFYDGGGSNTARGLEVARTAFNPIHGARTNVAQIAIIISDGLSDNMAQTINQANLLKRSGVTIIAVGIGSEVNQAGLEDIASANDLVYRVNDFRALSFIEKQLTARICTNRQDDSCIQMSCKGRPDGDYPACDPECREGYYYTCSNQYAYRRECGAAYYLDDYNVRFLARMVFNPATDTCERESASCPRDPANCRLTTRPTPTTSTTTTTTTTTERQLDCVWSPSDCYSRPNGNYALCAPECQTGFYITCSNNYGYKMECGAAYYLDDYNVRFLARMVFNPATDTCERESASCPRDPANCRLTTRPTPTTTTTTTTERQLECVWSPSDCHSRPNGNYALCAPECQTGFYISCSNNYGYKMPCGLAFYNDNYGSFTARMVYNAAEDCCEPEHPSCPRNPRVAA